MATSKDIFGDIFNAFVGPDEAQSSVDVAYGLPPGTTHNTVDNIEGNNGGTTTDSSGKTPCDKCSPTNFPSCIDCFKSGAYHTLESIGVNIVLFVVLVIGIILLFDDEVRQAGTEVLKKAPELLEAL